MTATRMIFPQHYKNDCLSKITHDRMNEWIFNDTPAQKTDQLLGVRKGKRMKWTTHDRVQEDI